MLPIKFSQDFNFTTIHTQTGVYLYKDTSNTIIFGKAKNLRVRIKSYFTA
ncbi:MAG: hypothetical protein WAX77_04820 [Methylococcaceae bacterium]